MLADSGSAVLVHGPECAELAHAADPAEHGVTHVLPVADLRRRRPAGGHRAGSPLAPDADPVDLDDPVLILYTSGTTGRPKGAVLTHGNITWNTVNLLAHVDVLSTDVALCAAPLFHVTGLGQVSLPTLLKGGTVVVVPKFDAGGFLALIERRRVTCILGGADDAADDVRAPRLGGGGPVVAALRDLRRLADPRARRPGLARPRRRAAAGLRDDRGRPGRVHGPAATARPSRPVSAGRPALLHRRPGSTSTASRRRAGPGELLVRGPNVFAGYWNRPEETAQVLTDGWFRSGDVVRIDDDGWAYVVDRVKDLIISGGENIYPAEVEAAIAELADVSAAAVVAVPDPKWGEVGCAYVVLRAGADLDEIALRAHLDQRLARYKIPRYVEFCDDLPRNATGKVLRAVAARAGPRDHPTPLTSPVHPRPPDPRRPHDHHRAPQGPARP